MVMVANRAGRAVEAVRRVRGRECREGKRRKDESGTDLDRHYE